VIAAGAVSTEREPAPMVNTLSFENNGISLSLICLNSQRELIVSPMIVLAFTYLAFD
jgi:hypothetical protein